MSTKGEQPDISAHVSPPVHVHDPAHDLAHVVVSGGTPQEWLAMSAAQWDRRIDTLMTGAQVGAVRWVTLLPHHGRALDDSERARLRADLGVHDDGRRKLRVHGSGDSERYIVTNDMGVTLIIDPEPDGQRRFAASIESLRRSGHDPDAVTEELVSQLVLAPAVDEPDLVLILGPPDRLPESMVWELAYSELVFLDLGWSDLVPTHLELAIDDFARRHRRFGGLDS